MLSRTVVFNVHFIGLFAKSRIGLYRATQFEATASSPSVFKRNVKPLTASRAARINVAIGVKKSRIGGNRNFFMAPWAFHFKSSPPLIPEEK